MSYQFYKVLHLIGIFFILLALGGIAMHVINGGTREFKNRKWIAMMHGFGMLISIVAGFGLLAKLGYMKNMPAWSIMKMGIWLVMGAAPALFYRKANLGKPLWFTTLVLAGIAAWLAIYKPFTPAAVDEPAAVESSAPSIGTSVPTDAPPAEPSKAPEADRN